MIRTSRLQLRRPRGDDLDAVYAYRSRADVAHYLSAGTWTREQTRKELETCSSASFHGPGDELVFLAELRATGAVIGEVGLTWLDADEAAEVGYVFNPAFAGHGFASEAVSAVLSMALDEYGFTRVIARTDAANRASRALCERLGMTFQESTRSRDGRDVEEVAYTTSSP